MRRRAGTCPHALTHASASTPSRIHSRACDYTLVHTRTRHAPAARVRRSTHIFTTPHNESHARTMTADTQTEAADDLRPSSRRRPRAQSCTLSGAVEGKEAGREEGVENEREVERGQQRIREKRKRASRKSCAGETRGWAKEQARATHTPPLTCNHIHARPLGNAHTRPGTRAEARRVCRAQRCAREKLASEIVRPRNTREHQRRRRRQTVAVRQTGGQPG